MDHSTICLSGTRIGVTEGKAEAAFQELLSSSEDFILQASDRKDYGTDCQIEVIDHKSATNVRLMSS